MNIWQFQNQLSKRLLSWSIFSVVTGFIMMRGNAFWRGVGSQFVGWGLIDGLIALFGQTSMDSRIDNLDNPGDVEVKQKEAKNLEQLLWINAGLDVLYMLGGRRWAEQAGNNPERRGHGVGIFIQGAFLFVFDIYHALTTPKEQ